MQTSEIFQQTLRRKNRKQVSKSVTEGRSAFGRGDSICLVYG